MKKIISIGETSKSYTNKQSLFAIYYKYGVHENFKQDFKRVVEKGRSHLDPAIMDYIFRQEGVDTDSYKYEKMNAVRILSQINEAMRLDAEGKITIIYGDTDDIKILYKYKSRVCTPDEFIIVFIALRHKYIVKEKLEAVGKFNNHTIGRLEKLGCTDTSLIIEYCQLVAGLLNLTFSLKEVYLVYKDTITNEDFDAVVLPTIDNVPKTWIEWGYPITPLDRRSLVLDYKEKRQLLGLTQKEIADKAGIKQSNISAMETKGVSSPVNFIKYCYHIALAQQQQQTQEAQA